MTVSSAPVSSDWVVPNRRSLSRGPRSTTSCGPPLLISVAASTCSAVRVTCSTGRRSSRSRPCTLAMLCGALLIQTRAGSLRP